MKKIDSADDFFYTVGDLIKRLPDRISREDYNRDMQRMEDGEITYDEVRIHPFKSSLQILILKTMPLSLEVSILPSTPSLGITLVSLEMWAIGLVVRMRILVILYLITLVFQLVQV
jgi:hypothetical protein